MEMCKLPKLTKLVGLRTLKTGVGAALAVFIAQLLNLNYGINAGIVVILSLQNTRRKSFQLAAIRISATFFALLIGALVFSVVGFNAVAFGLYLLLFIPFAVRFKLNDGIVPASVLVSHLLGAEDVSLVSLGNEMAQMIIGAGIALILNIYMPGLEKRIKEDLEGIKRTKLELIRNIYKTLENFEFSDNSQMLIDEMNLRIDNSLDRLEFDKNEYTIFNLNDYTYKISKEKETLQSLVFLNKLAKKLVQNKCNIEELIKITKEVELSIIENQGFAVIIGSIEKTLENYKKEEAMELGLLNFSIIYQFLEEMKGLLLLTSDNSGKSCLKKARNRVQ